MSKSFSIACVVDNVPRFFTELVLWVICVERFLPRDVFRPIVYLVGDTPLEIAAWLQDRGIACRSVLPMVPGSPHCNKIAPFLDDHAEDYTIVSDVDLFFVDDPSVFFRSDGIRAAPNNHCNPPGRIFRDILAASGLNRSYRPGVAIYRNGEGLRESHINNISGGIVGLPSGKAALFASRWKNWAEWLVKNRTLLSRWEIHVDQVSFALAAEDIGVDVEFLPPQVNTILHSLNEISTVYALHLSSGHIPRFPELFNEDRTLNPAGLEDGVADGIERLNGCIQEAMRLLPTLGFTRDHIDTFMNPKWHRKK